MTAPALDRPLRLGEVLAETVRLYGSRVGAAAALGALVAAAYLLTLVLPLGFQVLLIAVVLTAGAAIAARVVAGDGLGAAIEAAWARAAVLALLTFLVAVPFVLVAPFALLLIVAAAWLALVGLAIPATVVEGLGARDALGRGIALARVQYLHAFGVLCALLFLYVLVGQILAVALVGFADNREVEAAATVQLVLAPFFFFGLSVLYFEQRAREPAARAG